jgi:hypothetical protein
MRRALILLLVPALTLVAATHRIAAQVKDEQAPATFRARFETSSRG